MTSSPRDFGIPYDTWRPHQHDMCRWAQLNDGVAIIQAATGFGKSVLPVYLSHFGRTVVLTRTKALQMQYRDIFGADILMGRGNYKCIHPENGGRTCQDCLHADEGMHRCEHSHDCIYLRQKHIAMASRLACVNYACWLSAKSFRDTKIKYLVLDECHLLSDICLEWVGTTMGFSAQREYNLSPFPQALYTSNATMDVMTEWMGDTIVKLRGKYAQIKSDVEDNPSLTKEMRKIERMGFNISACLEALSMSQDAWYIRSGAGVVYRKGSKVPGMVIRPLTARHHFQHLFMGGGWKTLMMSATVGDFGTFSEELGITGWEPLTNRVPSNFPPSTRPIYLLDAPKMSHKSTDKDYEKQAKEISGAVRRVSTDWPGLIHVTRKVESRLLAQRLEALGLSGRIWVPPYKNRWGHSYGTNEQVELWHDWLKDYPNSIAVTWQFHEGYDGLDEKICIIAKVQFPFLGDSYERARMKYSGRMYLQRTAWMLQQSLGRTRRGRPEDYDTPDELRGMVAIADGNWVRVQKYIDPDFREAMVKI